MPAGELFIKLAEVPQTDVVLGRVANGQTWYDAFVRYGVSFEDGAISALRTLPTMKELVENKNRLRHGKQVLRTTARMDEMDYTLPFHIVASSKEDFESKYNSFRAEVLQAGYFDIRTSWISDATYKFTYQSCTQLTQFRGEMAVFSLKVNEPDPSDRD